MRATYNVLDQNWIPVISGDGSRRFLSLRQTIAQAHQLREISDPSPLEEYSLYRFLAVFLMDALRLKKRSNIRALLRDGRFDMALIEKYIDDCRAEGVSFDLFDEERPFLQCRSDEEADGPIKPVSVLDCTLPSGNNHIHFNHARQETLPPDRALRLLLATYWFCTAAAQGYPSGVYGAPPLLGVIKGKNLFETLTAMLFPLDSIGIPFDDPPVMWRRTAPVVPKAQIGKTSWLQGMLFPTRRINLVYDESGTVTGVHLTQGENYVNKDTWVDPYATYRSNETSVFPLRPHSDSPIWRNYCDIIDIPGNHASKMLSLYQSIHGDEDIHLTLYGVETSQASYLSMHRYDLTLPLRLADSGYVELMTACIGATQQLRKALGKACGEVEVIPEAAVDALVTKFDKACEGRFWCLCEEADFDKYSARNLYSDFCSDVADVAIRSYDALSATLKLRAHDLATAEEKKKIIYGEIKKLTGEAKKT